LEIYLQVETEKMKKADKQTKSKSWKAHSGMVLDSVDTFDVIDCEVCGFKHIIPVPTLEEVQEAYRREYYSTEKPLYIERAKEDLDWWNLAYGERYDVFEQLLPSDSRKILDIGSGPGYFLLHGKQRGWETSGIEPSAQAAEHSRQLGLEIIEDFLTEETSGQLGTFDVVHASEVIEHISNPKSILKLAYSLLNPGGLLCIVAPNDYNPFQNALREVCGHESWWVAPPHHINYFCFESLRRLVQLTGFEIVNTGTTFPMEFFLLCGENYVGDDSIGRQCHAKRKNFELNLKKAGLKKFRHELYQFLASKNVGREIVLFARKN
jgi:SAM-dependent methyltransferase